jgi:SAM-dependent methyltransferase
MKKKPYEIYESGDYLASNPTWDIKDSPWKASKVLSILRKHQIEPKTICEVGCGAGGVLGAIQREFTKTKLTGFDIAPDAQKFWKELKDSGIDLHVGDFFKQGSKSYEAILLLDVLEHVTNPHQFLVEIRPRAEFLVVHFPLDLSALSVIREKPLLYVRHKVGHIHYFTKGLAIELLKECGFEIIDFQYTGATFSAPQRGIKTKVFSWLRRLIYAINKDIGVRLLGGETLIILAKKSKEA